ncbi:hypothetical protein QUB47_19070 [Microcoleus sp. AT9_B5]
MATKGKGIKPKLQKGDKAKSTIRQELTDKKEAIIRQGQVDMLILRHALGIAPGGDMKDFVRALEKNLKNKQ